MYYKKAKENFTFSSTVNYKPVNTEKFPVWALILLVSLIALIIGLILYYYLNKKKKIQQFGFRFY